VLAAGAQQQRPVDVEQHEHPTILAPAAGAAGPLWPSSIRPQAFAG